MSSPLAALHKNPIRLIRTRMGQSLETFAENVGIHFQVLRLTEWGCYSSPSDKILDYLESYGVERAIVCTEYWAFVKSRREAFREAHRELGWALSQERVTCSPIEAWAASLGLPRTRLAKELCVQPANLYRMSNGKTNIIPNQVICAFRDIGFDEDLIATFEQYQKEFSNAVRHSN